METTIYERFKADKAEGKKNFVVLIDPDDIKTQSIEQIVQLASRAKVDCFFMGGSLIMNDTLDYSISQIKEACNIPVVLFPGNTLQLSYRADAMLFLSLISGRNPELLIGKHVETASYLYASPLEIISTGYMLIDGGVPTSVSYMSNTYPIRVYSPCRRINRYETHLYGCRKRCENTHSGIHGSSCRRTSQNTTHRGRWHTHS